MQVLTVTDKNMHLRSQAASYAKGFLAKKYWKEYQELYDAYLVNRGVNIRRRNAIDEREIVKGE